MKKFTAFALLLLLLPLLANPSHAADKKKEVKAAKEVKKETRESVILMPLRPTKDIPQDEMTQYEAALEKSLSGRYVVYSGERVVEKVRDVYRKRSAEAKEGEHCDETKCIQDLAIEFQTGLVAMANIRKTGSGYSVSLKITDVMEDKSVFSEQKTCKGCDEFQVMDLLRTIAGGGVASPPSAAPAVETSAAQASKGGGGEDKESLYWNSIKDSTNADDFAAYLESYPKGTFVPLAKSRMASLKKSAVQTPEATSKKTDAGSEVSLWKSVKDSTNPDDLDLYLQAYPSGSFSTIAKNRMESLKKAAEKAAEKAAIEKVAAEKIATEKAVAEKAAAEETARVATERAAAKKAVAEEAARLAAEKFAAEQAAAPKGMIEGMVYVKQGNGGFYMDTTEVTQEAYQRVIGSNPSNFKGCLTCPVETVTWDEADAYCKKVGKRLPTEQEWEYSATSGGKGETFAGTSNESELGDYAWYRANAGRKTHPVGGKKPNGLGLYDMSGNVWEWTDSWYDDSKRYRVLRGGSWSLLPTYLRASNRLDFTPGAHIFLSGFRCAQ